MTHSFQKGDLVSVLNEAIKGSIVDIQSDQIMILDEDGFERVYQAKELVLRDRDSLLNSGKLIRKDFVKKKTRQIKKTKTPTTVVDLHYKNKHADTTPILSEQIAQFTYHLNQAIRSKQKSIVFIHGVGTGVLRKKIETILHKRGLSYADAPYYLYGYGAIEIFF